MITDAGVPRPEEALEAAGLAEYAVSRENVKTCPPDLRGIQPDVRGRDRRPLCAA